MATASRRRALKERERRLDGLFHPARESAQQPVVILEAQMAADAGFLRARVHWIELEAAAADPAAPPLLRALALLVEPEELCAMGASLWRT